LLNSKFQSGFTYIGILMIIAISGIALAGVGIVWHQHTQRENEKELLYIGDQYRKAILSYYENSPSGVQQYPKELKDLLTDERMLDKKVHHIRKLYADPISHGKPWELVRQGDQITGVYSSSKSSPIKKTGFPAPYESFSEAKSYQDWKFTANQQQATPDQETQLEDIPEQ
jgi:type II secretory pathway pseudopilin PulG